MSPLLTKLRYRPGMRVCVLDAPSGFAAELANLPKTIECTTALKGPFDLVHAFFTRKSQVQRSAAKLKKALQPDGILWISYPKGDTLSTDLKRDVLRDTLAAAGLDSVAQVAIDDVWSAMRFKLVQSPSTRTVA
jgi:hypothetical protein